MRLCGISSDHLKISLSFVNIIQKLCLENVKEGNENGIIKKKFRLQNPRWEKAKLTIRNLYKGNKSVLCMLGKPDCINGPCQHVTMMLSGIFTDFIDPPPQFPMGFHLIFMNIYICNYAN